MRESENAEPKRARMAETIIRVHRITAIHHLGEIEREVPASGSW